VAVLSLAPLVAQHCLMNFVSSPTKTGFTLASFAAKTLSAVAKVAWLVALLTLAPWAVQQYLLKFISKLTKDVFTLADLLS
jgi:hypothetical protein